MADYKWQKEAVKRFARERISAIIADCGTGKTLAGIRIAIAKRLPVLVIVPKNVTGDWVEAIHEFAGPDEKIWNYDAPTEHKDPEEYARQFLAWLRPEPGELEAMRERKAAAEGEHHD